MNMQNFYVEPWALTLQEVGYYVPIEGKSTDAFQLYIPKLLPMVKNNMGTSQSKVPLVTSCFVNDPACMPGISKVILTQTYKTVPQTKNREFANELMTEGTKVLVDVVNGNPDQMFVSTKLDGSTKPPPPEEEPKSNTRGLSSSASSSSKNTLSYRGGMISG